MKLVGQSYKAKLPWYLKVAVIAAAATALTTLIFFVAALFGRKLICNLGDFGTQGDFFGGHIAAVVGSITLLVVILTGYMQLVYERRFRIREHFLSGISVIGQYDIAESGCEQAMRLLDYYSGIALELKEDELLLLLNTVMTKDIRKRLEELDGGKQEIYLEAREARRKIQEMLKNYHIARKQNSNVEHAPTGKASPS